MIITTNRLLDYKDYGDRMTPKSKQLVIDEKNIGKFKKYAKDGRAYDYKKCRSNEQTTFQQGDSSKRTKGYFIYDGPYRKVEGSKKEQLNAILVKEGSK